MPIHPETVHHAALVCLTLPFLPRGTSEARKKDRMDKTTKKVSALSKITVLANASVSGVEPVAIAGIAPAMHAAAAEIVPALRQP